MTPMLGYGQLVKRSDRWTKGNAWPAGLFKNLAAFLLFAGLGGFGTQWQMKTEDFIRVIPVLNVLLFMAYLGKGSLDSGFKRVINFFSNLTQHVGDFLTRLTENIIPFLVNLAIIAFVVTLVKIGVHFLFGLPFVTGFLRGLPFIDNDTPVSVFKAFLNQLWVIPLILKYSAIILDWSFFSNAENE